MSDWSLHINTACERLSAENVTCMICYERLAVGHTSVKGGPNNGRLLLVHCPVCVPANPPDDPAEDAALARIQKAIAEQAMAGLLNLFSGGPGRLGEPSLLHNGHLDPWPPPNTC